MGLIKYDIYDIATRHPADEFCNKMNKEDEWVIMCFNTDFVYYANGEMHHGQKYQCLINSPNDPVIHGPAENSEDGFENDWIILYGNEVTDLIERLELPVNVCFTVTNFNCLTDFLVKIREEEKNPMFYSDEYVSSVITDMFIYVARHRRIAEYYDTNAYRALKQVRLEMLENYNRKVTISQLSENSGYSPSRFCELYKKFYGSSPIDDLINMRISKAKQLLVFSTMSVGEIAEKCGFESIHYFSNAFKKVVRCSPAQYRKRER